MEASDSAQAETAASTEYPGIPDLKPVTPRTKPAYLPIWAPLYELKGNSTFPGSPHIQTSLYEPYDVTTPGWWYNLLEEFTYAGINRSLIVTRASVNESKGWQALKSNLFSAMQATNLSGQLQFAEFEDAGAWPSCYRSIKGGDPRVDWSDAVTIDKIFWDLMLKRFFDAVPKDRWFRWNGRPLWVGWGSGSSVTNQNTQSNIRRALLAAKSKFKARYGEELFMVIDQSWKKADTTITGQGDADGVQSWFCCGNAGSFYPWNGINVGVGVPGFQALNSEGCPMAHDANFDRNHGAQLKDRFDRSVAAPADLFIEEGYVDMRESAGIYRSPSWDFPSQYLEIVREFLDPATETRRLQAEAADFFSDSTPANQGGQFSSRALDVAALPGHGWYVGWTTAGEWLEWNQVYLASGQYDVYIRYASSATDNRVTLAFGCSSKTVSLASTSGAFTGTKIISGISLSGKTDVQLTFATPGIQVDFIQLDKD